jgi:hypothetical protein
MEERGQMSDDKKPMLISELAKELAIAAELDRLDQEQPNSAKVEVNTQGVEASVSAPTKWGARVTAFFKQQWNGQGREAGARIEKKF